MQIFLCLGKNRRKKLPVKSMQKRKIVVNIIFWFQNYGKMTDEYIYIYIYIYIYTYTYTSRRLNMIKYELNKDGKWSPHSPYTRYTRQFAHCPLLPRARLHRCTRKDAAWCGTENYCDSTADTRWDPACLRSLPLNTQGVYCILLQVPRTALVWTELNVNKRKQGWETSRCDVRSLGQIQKECSEWEIVYT